MPSYVWSIVHAEKTLVSGEENSLAGAVFAACDPAALLMGCGFNPDTRVSVTSRMGYVTENLETFVLEAVELAANLGIEAEINA